MTIELVKKNYSQAKVTAMVIDARPARMAGGKSLPRVENERVVAEARTDPNRVSKRVSTKPVSRATIASNQASLCVYFFDPWV